MGIFAQIGMATAVSLVLAVLLPLVLIFVQHEVRIRRIRLIEEFRRNFFYDPKASARAERAENERRRREAAEAETPPPSGTPPRPRRRAAGSGRAAVAAPNRRPSRRPSSSW
jgi:hypothetical protein